MKRSSRQHTMACYTGNARCKSAAYRFLSFSWHRLSLFFLLLTIAGSIQAQTPQVVATPNTQTVCNGSSTAPILFSGGWIYWGFSTTYTWSNNNTSIGLIGSGTGNSIPSFPTTNPGTATITINGVITGYGLTINMIPTTATITVNTTPGVPSFVSANPSLCSGVPITLKVSGASPGQVYVWYDAATGGNTLKTSVDNNDDEYITGSFYNSTTYYVSVKQTGTGCESARTPITIFASPHITVQPFDQSICSGQNATFSIGVVGSGLSYQWQEYMTPAGPWSDISNGGIYSGATTSQLLLTAPTALYAGYKYRCIVSIGSCTVTSAEAVLSFTSGASIITQPGNQNPCAGDPAVFSVVATGSTYQWYYGLTCHSGSIVPENGTYSGTTTSSLVIQTTSPVTGGPPNGYNYWVVINTPGCGSPVTSTCGLLTVLKSPYITSNPSNTTVCEGATNVTFSVTTNTTFPNPPIASRQWEYSPDNGANWYPANGGPYSNGNTNTLTINSVTLGMNGYLYRFYALTSGGCKSTSTTAVLNVVTTPTISTQPTNMTICNGDNTSFSVTATSTGSLSYRWQVNTGSGWVNVPTGAPYSGETTPTLSITGGTSSMNGYQYRCVVSVVSTTGCSATSNPATLTVNNPPTINTQPTNQSACTPGGPVSFTVSASNPLAYQWQVSTNGGATWNNVSNGGVYTGATSATLSISNTTSLNGYQYRCVLGIQCLAVTNAVTLTENDTEPPVAVCKNIIVNLDATGNAAITPGMVDNGSHDNCGITSMSVSPANLTCANITQPPGFSEIFISEYIEGTSNNKAIEIYNGTSAAINLAAGGYNLQMFFNGSGTVGLTINLTGSVAAGDVYVIAQSSANAAILAQADQTNNAGWYDGNDAVVLRKGTTIIDVIGQIGFNPGTEWGSGLTSTENNTLRRKSSITIGDSNGSDAFDPSVEWIGYPTDDFTGLGSHAVNQAIVPVTLTVYDAAGLSSSCTSMVTLVDNTPPNAICQNITVPLNSSGTASITAAQINNGSNDNCGIQSMSVSPSTFNCTNIGSNAVTLTVIDVNGNVSTCNATVTVVDNTAPTAICKNITVQLNASGTATIAATDVDNGSTDNCSIASRSVSPNSFNCSNVGANTVTLTVTDPSGNTATCSAIVTVQDNTPPTAVCQNITVSLDGTGTVTILPSQINNGSTDACGIGSMTVTPNTFNCTNVGQMPVFNDLIISEYVEGTSNNKAIEIYNGTNNPINLALGGYNIQMFFNGSGTVGLTINLTGTVAAGDVYVIAHSSAAAAILAQADQTESSAWYNGNNAVVLRKGTTIIDVIGQIGFDPGTEWGTGLTSTADNTLRRKPSINIGDNNGSDAFDPSIEWIGYATNDFSGLGAHTVSPAGVPVTLTVTDVNGNTSTCSSIVTVQDNTPPTFTFCPTSPPTICASGAYTHSGTGWNATATDACGILTLTYSLSGATTGTGASLNGVVFNQGTTTVTWTATDVNGNSSTCVFTVIVAPLPATSAIYHM